jgi:hypothetical protein
VSLEREGAPLQQAGFDCLIEKFDESEECLSDGAEAGFCKVFLPSSLPFTWLQENEIWVISISDARDNLIRIY